MKRIVEINQEVMQEIMNSGKIVTYNDIAKVLGLSLSTVANILQGHNTKNYTRRANYSAVTVELVERVANQMKYDPRKAIQIGHCSVIGKHHLSPITSTSGNFATRKEETERMLYLRNKKFMSNAQIAKKIGVCYLTVLKRIGYQPEEITEMSSKLRGEVIVRRNQMRRNLMLKQKIAEFEKYQAEIKESEKRANELEQQAQKIADEARIARESIAQKIIDLDSYRKEAEKAARELEKNLA